MSGIDEALRLVGEAERGTLGTFHLVELAWMEAHNQLGEAVRDAGLALNRAADAADAVHNAKLKVQRLELMTDQLARALDDLRRSR